MDKLRRDDLVGYALLLAADDWHRVLPGRFVPQDRLLAQTRRHLARTWPQLAADDAALAAALVTVTTAPALLEHDGQGRYRQVCPDGEPVLPAEEPRRAAPLADLTPLEAVDVGNRCRHHGDIAPATVERAYRLAVAGGDPDAAAFGALGLAELALEQRNLELARQRFVEVASLDHEDASLKARLTLAEIAVAEGDLLSAGRYAQQVADSVHPELAPEALELVSELQWELGQWDQALATVRRAVDADGPLRTPSMILRLARMLVVQGKVTDAMAVYERLLRDPAIGSSIAVEYVTSATMVGLYERVRRQLSAVLDPEDPVTFCPYALALTEAHIAAGDYTSAAALLGEIRAHPGAGTPLVEAYADVLTARLAAVNGDPATAQRLFAELADTDDPAWRQVVRPLLLAEGMRLRDQGVPCTTVGFRPVLEYLTEAAPAEDAAWAMYSLGLTALHQRRLAEAENALRLVAKYGETDSLASATAAIGHVKQLAGDTDGAVAHCLDLIARGSVPVAIEGLTAASLVLARSSIGDAAPVDVAALTERRDQVRDLALTRMDTVEGEQQGQLAFAVAVFDSVPVVPDGTVDAAAEMFELAARTGPPALAAAAWMQAGTLREDLGQPVRAVAAYQQAVGCADPATVGVAALRMAALAHRLGDHDLAVEAYCRGLDQGSGPVFAECAFACGFTLERDHPDDAEEAYRAVLDEPDADRATVGRAMARLGALHARHGNRRLAQQVWRRGRRDPDPRTAAAFAAERRSLGRVRRLRPS